MGSYEKLFLWRGGAGGGGGWRLILVTNSLKSKYCSLFSKYSVQIKQTQSNYKKKGNNAPKLSMARVGLKTGMSNGRAKN